MSGRPAAAPVQRLCDECQFDGGWLYVDVELTTPDGRTVFEQRASRCTHGQPADAEPEPATSTPDEARDASLAAMEDSPHLATAVEIIRLAATRNATVTANLVRPDMDAAQIPGPVRGLAFRHAIGRRFIRSAGYEPSTDPSTHAHPVRQYESLRYTGGAW